MKIMSIHISLELPDDVQPENATVLVNKKANKSSPVRKKTGRSFKRWTKKETKFIIENYGSMEYDKIAEALGKDKRQVINKAYFLRKQGKIKGRIEIKPPGRPPKYLEKINDNGNGKSEENHLTCADCPKGEKESNGTVFCTIDKVRKKADTPMCQEMIDILEKVEA